MSNELLNNPEARFNAALSFATSEFQGQIDKQGYNQVPTPYFPEIYASEYFTLVEHVLELVRQTRQIDVLFTDLIEISKKRAASLNKQAIDNGKTVLAKELGKYPEDMPDADEYDKIERMWEKA